jgi:hypothetical protein
VSKSGLRNEDYVAFLDESGTGRLQIVSGVLIPVRWLRPAEHRWRAFIKTELGSRSGQTEVKSRQLLHGEGVSLHAQTTMLASGHPPLTAKVAGRQFFRRALEHIAGIAEVRVLTVALPTTRPAEVYRLWFWMAYAALVEKKNAPRPRLPLIVIDGQDASFRRAQELIAYRFYRQFPRCQPMSHLDRNGSSVVLCCKTANCIPSFRWLTLSRGREGLPSPTARRPVAGMERICGTTAPPVDEKSMFLLMRSPNSNAGRGLTRAAAGGQKRSFPKS